MIIANEKSVSHHRRSAPVSKMSHLWELAGIYHVSVRIIHHGVIMGSTEVCKKAQDLNDDADDID